MQRVHRHVVERPAAGLAEVPTRVDRVGARALRLVLVVAAEGGAADRPREGAELTGLDAPADLLVVWAQHLAGRGDDAEVTRPCELDQLRRLGGRRRHRLVDVDVLARLERLLTLLVVEADGRGDRDRVDLAEQVVVRLERVWDAEPLGHARGAPGRRVADGRHAHAVVYVRQREVRQDPALRQRPAADDAEPDQRRCSTAKAMPSAGP